VFLVYFDTHISNLNKTRLLSCSVLSKIRIRVRVRVRFRVTARVRDGKVKEA
jgi:hypothetical protein